MLTHTRLYLRGSGRFLFLKWQFLERPGLPSSALLSPFIAEDEHRVFLQRVAKHVIACPTERQVATVHGPLSHTLHQKRAFADGIIRIIESQNRRTILRVSAKREMRDRYCYYHTVGAAGRRATKCIILYECRTNPDAAFRLLLI